MEESQTIQNQPEENIIRPKPKGNHLIIALLIVIIVILLGILLYLFIFINKGIAPSSRTRSATSTNVSKVNKTSNIHKVLNPYQGWKTYTSPVNGVSFRYPSSWSIKVNIHNMAPVNSLNPYTVRLTNNGNTISFSDNTSAGSGYMLADLIQPITASGKNYDLLYANYSSISKSNCPEIANVPASYPSTPLPQSCKATFQIVFLNNISDVKTVNGNSFGGALMGINGAAGMVSLTLATPINTSSVNSNQYVKVFKQFLSTVKF